MCARIEAEGDAAPLPARRRSPITCYCSAKEEQGDDVAFVCCGNDPAITEARASVRIPVVGMTEASMHLA